MSTTDLVLTKQDKHALILYQDPFSLVDENITFTTREEVAKNLPDICSRALARSWIDKGFYDMLSQDPIAVFRTQGITLPDNMTITFDHSGKNRPKLIVYETNPNSKFKVRVCALTLTMMAQR
jgi:hypothetical protein